MLKRLCAAIAAFLVPTAIGAGTASVKEIHQFVDSLPILPPELAADAMLRLVENGKIADQQWRISLLEEAYRLAGSAKYPFPVVGATSTALDTDSDAGIRQIALSGKIDQLSLRCRAVNQMLEFEPD